MLQYLIVILENQAPSFCHYDSVGHDNILIDLNKLKDVVFFAQKENLSVNFIIGENTLPPEYEEVMGSVRHISLVSINNKKANEQNICILDSSVNTAKLKEQKYDNYILRLKKTDLPNLSNIVIALGDSYTRLNVINIDIDKYNEKDFKEYKNQIEKINNYILSQINSPSIPQINTLTDRILLNEMHNCNAGVTHLTVAPNGKFYICPAFYYENVNDSVGDLYQGLFIPNKHLYTLEYAPICKQCDAYQCKRCVYLNRKTTLEVNTPSREQCLLSHIEREGSSVFLKNGGKSIPSFSTIEIKDLNYCDPFELFEQ